MAEQALYWLDIVRRRLYRRTANDSLSRRWIMADYPGCLAELIDKGSLAVTMGEGLQKIDLESGVTRLLCKPNARRPNTRFNDGKVDARGRLWVGTMQNNIGPQGENLAIERSDGSLFRFSADASCQEVEQDIGVSNTLAWSPDERRFYFADSVPGCIYVYDYDGESGTIANRRIHFDAPGFGIPDGSAIDIDGCLWNARWDGSSIIKITPDGRVDGKITLPVPRPTSCIFGGPRFETLFVTSARLGLSPAQLEEFPLSGAVFAVEGVARGMPVPPFTWRSIV